MNSFGKTEVKTFSEWLEIATATLALPAQLRINAEIEAHHAESVQAHIDEGQSESDSQTAALSELGDPKTAANRFRKHHLTQSEVSKIQTSFKAGRNK